MNYLPAVEGRRRRGGQNQRAIDLATSNGAEPAGPSAAERLWRTVDGAPPPWRACRAASAGELATPDRALLDRAEQMTRRLAAHHGSAIGLRVLARRVAGDFYHRRVVLIAETTGAPVELAVLRVALAAFEARAREAIVAGRTPFGAVLDMAGLPYTVERRELLAFEPGPELARLLGAPSFGGVVYGRRSAVVSPSAGVLSEAVEILPPPADGRANADAAEGPLGARARGV